MDNNIYTTPMNTVAYLRLSREDGDGESSSISNQRRIITKFAQDRGMVIDEFYIDDGYSGFTMDRPAFNQLKRDLNNDVVGTVIFKDLSRLSRHNAKSQLFLENILDSGKRALTVYEGYDTFDPKTHKMVGIYGWMNEDYIRDASMKTKDAVSTLQKEGVYVNCVPYGYMKDPINKHLYYIDKTTAPYVRLMFDLYINGMGVRAIAQKFNEENIPTCTTIRKQRLEGFGKATKYKPTLWGGDAIKRMLSNTFYIGTLTLNKTMCRTINGKRLKNTPDKHYVFENAHEPIIDQTTFNLAQEISLQRKKKTYRGTKINRPNIFNGMLVCHECNKNMTSSSQTQNTRYVCSSYNKYGTSICTSHAIMEYQIKETLLVFLKDCREELIKILGDFDIIFQRETNKQDDLNILQKDLDRIKQEVKVLMEQKMREIIKNPNMESVIDNMYSEAMNDKYKMISCIEKQIEDTINLGIKESSMKQNFKSTINMLDEIINSQDITKKQVLILVDKIVVYEDSSLDIYLNGDLHELCNNKINIKESLQDNLDRIVTDYILAHQSHIAPTSCWRHVRDYGIAVGYIKFAKYFNKFLESGMIEKIGGERQGYRFISTEKALKAYTQYNNVVDNIGGLNHNDVTLELLITICNLGASYKNINKKLLF